MNITATLIGQSITFFGASNISAGPIRGRDRGSQTTHNSQTRYRYFPGIIGGVLWPPWAHRRSEDPMGGSVSDKSGLLAGTPHEESTL